MQPARLRLGQLLVDAHILTAPQLEQVLVQQRTDGRRLGTLLVEAGVVSETQLTQVLSQQLSVPWVSLHHIDFSRELLNRIPREVAEKYCLVPIYVRAVRGQGNTLYVAMDDPMHDEAVSECATLSGLPVRAMIAAPTDIRKAIRLYYTASVQPPAASREPTARPKVARPLRTAPPGNERGAAPPPAIASSPSPPPPPPRPLRSGPPPAPSVAPPPPTKVRSAPPQPASASSAASGDAAPSGSAGSSGAAASGDDDTPVLEVREIEIPLSRRRSQVQMTLLDGTQINVPTGRRVGQAAGAPVEEELSIAELMAALRAAAHGAEGALAPSMRWEKLMAALLSLLMKKHLVFDRELLEELKNI